MDWLRLDGKIDNFARKIKRNISSLVLEKKIHFKWLNDLRYLPLTEAHCEVYNIIHRLCWRELGEFPNLVNCRDFNDRIQWLKLFDQSLEIVRCSDKVLVRNYVRQRVGERYLVDLYQVCDHFSEIHFDILPKSFVIKTNHDSGTVIIVRDKTKLNRNEVENIIEAALIKPYGWENGEWAYSYVQPKVFVEEIINPESLTPPPDYKFHCVDGRIRWLQFIFDRGQTTKEVIVSPEGHITSIHFDHKMQHSEKFVVPDEWEKIKYIVETLAKGFKYVRVDTYCFNKKIYIGELTFFPLMGCYKGVGQKLLGKLLDFDRTTFKTPIISLLKKKHT